MTLAGQPHVISLVNSMKSKPRNSGTWTEARFHSFITGALRSTLRRWGPMHKVKKKANIRWGWYLCAGYKCKTHQVESSVKNGRKKVNNIHVDHISPVVDPATGFMSWDVYVERMFLEEEGLQVLCKKCHDAKTADERKLRKKK